MRDFYHKNLSSVTSATIGEAVNVNLLDKKVVWVNVSGNSGAVTLTIEASPDRETWYELDTETYNSSDVKKIFSYIQKIPSIRTKTSTHSNATVTTVITGGN